jgi:hypothetical protein
MNKDIVKRANFKIGYFGISSYIVKITHWKRKS